MSHQQTQKINWKKILAAGPYPIEAFAFVQEGLQHSVQLVHDDPDALSDEQQHITGQQLCLGLRETAIDKYGLLAPLVLEHWNIRRTNDFGRIVFAMIQAGLMSRTSDDTLDDFRSVYDFKEAFSREALLEHMGVE